MQDLVPLSTPENIHRALETAIERNGLTPFAATLCAVRMDSFIMATMTMPNKIIHGAGDVREQTRLRASGAGHGGATRGTACRRRRCGFRRRGRRSLSRTGAPARSGAAPPPGFALPADARRAPTGRTPGAVFRAPARDSAHDACTPAPLARPRASPPAGSYSSSCPSPAHHWRLSPSSPSSCRGRRGPRRARVPPRRTHLPGARAASPPCLGGGSLRAARRAAARAAARAYAVDAAREPAATAATPHTRIARDEAQRHATTLYAAMGRAPATPRPVAPPGRRSGPVGTAPPGRARMRRRHPRSHACALSSAARRVGARSRPRPSRSGRTADHSRRSGAARARRSAPRLSVYHVSIRLRPPVAARIHAFGHSFVPSP